MSRQTMLVYVILAVLSSSTLASVTGCAQQRPEPGSAITVAQPGAAGERERWVTENDQRVAAALDRLLAEVVFEDTPLESAVQWLATELRVNIATDWQDLEDKGIDRDSLLSACLRNVPIWRALDIVLDRAADGFAPLGYDVVDGVLVIASQERLDRDHVARVYPVADLLAALAVRIRRAELAGVPVHYADLGPTELFRATDPPYSKPQAQQRATAGQAASQPSTPDERTLRLAEEELEHLVTSMVAPDSWAIGGGGMGTLVFCNGTLAVRQCQRVHRELDKFLHDLRAAGASESAPASPGAQP